MNTMISGSAGGLTVLLVTYMKPLICGEQPYWSVLSTVNGGLAGMVTACAGCNNMGKSLQSPFQVLYKITYSQLGGLCNWYFLWIQLHVLLQTFDQNASR